MRDTPLIGEVTMRWTAACVAGVIVLAGGAAQAQVTGVVTHTSARLQFRPGAEPGNTGITIFEGNQINGMVGGNDFGSAGSFSSTSQVDDKVIEFQNGNVSGGTLTSLTSRTVVEISFTNDGETAVVPILQSTITPAGMGFFASSECLNNITASCTAGATYPGDFRNFQDFGAAADGRIVGAAFTFRITGGEEVVYELKGNLGLMYDAASNSNVIFSDMGDAQGALSGFRPVYDEGSQHEYGYVWDATDFEVSFPKGTLLLPGESSTLTYETIVETYSYTQCYQLLTGSCLVSYASFGDPIGRGGAIKPSLVAASFGESTGFEAFTYDFAYPTFSDGVLSYKLLPPTSPIPEPQSWALMIVGFGFIGSLCRRQRWMAQSPT
jgi:hypothetical protein